MKSPRPARSSLARLTIVVVITAAASAGLWLAGRADAPRASAQGPYRGYHNFESPQVHPLAMTPDGTRLLAVNSPENRLSVFQLKGGTPVLTAEIPVGLEPVSVAARNDREAWVVNWLSDSVSVVDLTTGNVTRTFDVGDEPTDVLFAGADNGRAFVCVSGTREVKVFDANAPAAPQVVTVRGKQPRALARDASGARVFVSVFESGNQTAVVPERVVTQNGGLPPPSPAMAAGLPAPPRTGLVVKWNGSGWADERGDARWTSAIPFRLADVDVAVIDAANASVSAELRGVGTQVGNAVYDPAAQRLLVVNTDAHNFTRFEPNLRGRFMRTRVSSVNPSDGASTPFDLNPHINYADPAGSDAERAQSLGLPSDIARASDGTLYVAALGSARVGVLDAAGAVRSRIGVGQGPTGLALDEPRSRLYVLNRFEQTLSVVDTQARGELTRVGVGFNPEPTEVREGRRFLYDASLSAHGDVSCASCHPGGHRDGLVWDLGDPLGKVDVINNPAGNGFLFLRFNPVSNFHPMKGPMMTQSLRGILDSRQMHWRGDRNDLGEFNPAFTNLLGRPQLLPAAEMQAFQAFVRTLVYPPNPLRNLDNSLSTNVSEVGGNAQRGFLIFNGSKTVLNVELCGACHDVGLSGTNSSIIPATLLQGPQDFKTPQLRGLYQKTGMENTPGEKLTAFGFTHDGTTDNLVTFLRNPLFTFPNDQDRRDVAAFLLSFDGAAAPIVGVQATVNAENKGAPELLARLNLFAAQVLMNRCDLVVRGIYKGEHRGFLYDKLSQKFDTDRAGEPRVSRQELLDAVGAGGELTFMGVLPGQGRRLGLDADGDGVLNGDEPPAAVNVSGRVVDAGGNGVAGVTVTLTGSQAATAVTDAAGRYFFGYVSTAGTHTVAPFRDGMSFGPASRTFANPSASQTGADFVAAASAIDSTQFFVAQHYRDFLSREPDAEGLQFWAQGIDSCGADFACREVRRVNTSAAFFLSIEFQNTGYLVYRTYKASFGDIPGKPVPVNFQQLLAGTQRIGQGVVVNRGDWQAQLDANKQAFFLEWVQRPDFLARYPETLSPADFINLLNTTAGSPLTAPERDALAAQLAADNTARGRAAALRQLAESAELDRREKNRAFVLMQYFGYLRRDPDDEGFNFWLTKLNQFNGDYNAAEMVKAFISSTEYRQRFNQ